MTFNLGLATKVLARIEVSVIEESGWDQDVWGKITQIMPNSDLVYDEDTGTYVGVGTCSTAKCFGGWALTFEGIKMRWEGDDHEGLWTHYTADGREISAVAAGLLGIEKGDQWEEWDDMPQLFQQSNDLDTLYRIVAEHADIEEDDLRSMVQLTIPDMFSSQDHSSSTVSS